MNTKAQMTTSVFLSVFIKGSYFHFLDFLF